MWELQRYPEPHFHGLGLNPARLHFIKTFLHTFTAFLYLQFCQNYYKTFIDSSNKNKFLWTEIKVENGFKSFLTSQLYKSLSKAAVREAGFGRIHTEFRRCHALLDHQNKLLLSSVCYWENFALFQLSLLALLRKPPEKQRTKSKPINAREKRQNPKPSNAQKIRKRNLCSVNTGGKCSLAANASIVFLCLLLLTEAICGLWLKNPPHPSHENKISEAKRNTQNLTYCAEARDAKLWFAGYLAFKTPRCS